MKLEDCWWVIDTSPRWTMTTWHGPLPDQQSAEALAQLLGPDEWMPYSLTHSPGNKKYAYQYLDAYRKRRGYSGPVTKDEAPWLVDLPTQT